METDPVVDEVDGGFYGRLQRAKHLGRARSGDSDTPAGYHEAVDRVSHALEALRMARVARDLLVVDGPSRALPVAAAWKRRALVGLQRLGGLHPDPTPQADGRRSVAEGDLAEAVRGYELARDAFLSLDRERDRALEGAKEVETVERDLKLRIVENFLSDQEA